MRKLLLFGVLVCALCSCGSGSGDSKKGHEYVDLGLPSGLKWATCNVGASSPEDYGDYYFWGGLSAEDESNSSTCPTFNKDINDFSENPEYDVARANWGGSWRMPTAAEFQELIDHCDWTWTTQNDRKGYKVTGPNGNSIFLPAAGGHGSSGPNPWVAGKEGHYWSSTPYRSWNDAANGLYLNARNQSVTYEFRSHGCSVRPVQGEKKLAEQYLGK